jgi:hypothetical protein
VSEAEVSKYKPLSNLKWQLPNPKNRHTKIGPLGGKLTANREIQQKKKKEVGKKKSGSQTSQVKRESHAKAPASD